jgi:hypothetical protein
MLLRGQFAKLGVQLKEHVLGGFFGRGGVAKNAQGDAENDGLVFKHQAAKHCGSFSAERGIKWPLEGIGDFALHLQIRWVVTRQKAESIVCKGSSIREVLQ